MPQDSVSAYTPLLFSHPRIGSLKIDTGMTSISWSYGLNTRSDQTYGGEVVQVLSCYADQMTITGETRSNAELQQIYDWFRSYMEQAGLHRRDERHVLFEYPERQWRFWIQPTQAPAMRFGTDLIATPWSMTAEIVQDDVEANALVEHTMSNFTSSILDKNFFDIGFQNFDPRNDPNGYPGPSFSQGLADNYQALLGSWAGGDYAHWGFDPLQSTSANNLPENTKSYWMQLLGTDYIAGNQGRGIAGGSVVYTGGPKTTDPVQIAGLIKSVLQLHGYQNWAWLAIAIGIVESGLNPNNRGNPASIGLFQPQVPPHPSRVSSGDPHYQDLRNAANHPGDPVVKYYTTQAQVEDFCSKDWFLNPSYIEQSHPEVWATNAQGPADTAGYQQKVLAAKAQAESLLRKFKAAGPFEAAALKIAATQIGQGEHPPGSNITKYGADYGLNGQPWCIIFITWCLKQAGSSFRYALTSQVVSDARAGKNGLSILQQPEPGCVVIYDFSSGHAHGEPQSTVNADTGQEHGNFFDSWVNRGSSFNAIGGNQSDGVTRTVFQVANVINYIKVSS